MSSPMDPTTPNSDLLLHPLPPMDRHSGSSNDSMGLSDLSSLQNQASLPLEFRWPNKDLAETQQPSELQEPVVDLKGFMAGDEVATARAVELVWMACSSHGFFQVINHGVDKGLIQAAYDEIEAVFQLPRSKKMSIKRKVGGFCGYSGEAYYQKKKKSIHSITSSDYFFPNIKLN